MRGVPLRFLARNMCPIPKAWEYFIVQTLGSAYNQYEFIVKQCMDLMSILNHEPINVGRLIVENIKYLADTPQRACGIFCIITKLCRLAWALSHSNDKKINLILPINQSSMRRISTHHIHEGVQEEAQNEEQDQYYHPEIQHPKGNPQQQQQQAPKQLKRLEENVLGMASWTTGICPNFYVEPPIFRQNFQAFYNEHQDHIPVQSLRKRFATAEDMETYFREKDQALTHRIAEMRTTWTRKNQYFQNAMDDVHNHFNSNNI